MKAFFRNVSPKRALLDLWQVLGAPGEYRWRSIVLAAMVTGGITWVMLQQQWRGLPHPPKVIYFPSYLPGRTDDQIRAENIEATRKARAAEAEEEARQERIRQMYRAVGNATGVDTKRPYDEGKAEREAAKKALDARNAEVLRKHLVKEQPAGE